MNDLSILITEDTSCDLGIAAVSRVEAWTFMRRVGRALMKATRNDVRILPDGRVRLVVEYPSLGDYGDAAVQLEALRALIQEDASARAPRGRPKGASSE